MSDVINGQFDEGVRLLLDVGGEGAQRILQPAIEMNIWLLVPLVLVFTKVDQIVPKVSSSGTAYTALEGQCRSLSGDVPAQIVSSD